MPPPVYFERLTGLRVGPSGKLRCLFHDDRSPSLHVYREPGRGWYCFGCGRGGSIYDLAALLSGRETRGQDFAELRRELEELMLPKAILKLVVASTTAGRGPILLLAPVQRAMSGPVLLPAGSGVPQAATGRSPG